MSQVLTAVSVECLGLYACAWFCLYMLASPLAQANCVVLPDAPPGTHRGATLCMHLKARGMLDC